MVRNRINPFWVVLLTILAVAMLFCIVTLILASVHGNDFATEIQRWFKATDTASKMLNL